jgi:hypothetical protein
MSEHLEWQRGLVAKYPALLDRAGADPRCVILIGDGWRRIVETMLARMDGILDETIGTWVTIDGIETKNGTMHVRSTGLVMDEAVKARIEEVSDLAEAKSAHVCEFCGCAGRLFEAPSGWLVTACGRHAGDGATPIAAGECDDLFVRRAFDGKRLRLVSCRRYLAAEDRFVDVDPHSVGLEE